MEKELIDPSVDIEQAYIISEGDYAKEQGDYAKEQTANSKNTMSAYATDMAGWEYDIKNSLSLSEAATNRANAASDGAEKVDASLNGTRITVTDRDGSSTTTNIGAVAMHISKDVLVLATDPNGVVTNGYNERIKCHLAQENSILQDVTASFSAGKLYAYITYEKDAEGSFFFNVAVPNNYQTYVGDYIDIVLTYDGHSYIKSLHVIPAKQGEKGEDGADGADGKDGGVIFPEMTYDPETGLLTINGDEGVVDRFTYNTTTGLLTIKISNI